MKTVCLSLVLWVIPACSELVSEPPSLGTAQQEAQQDVDHSCTLATLPTTCGVPREELDCCAAHSSRGEEQINCCDAAHNFVQRICANGAPSCPQGGTYPSCPGLVCPPLSAPCANGPGCCNDCGQIGPRGCSVCERADFDHVCSTHGLPNAEVCMGVYHEPGGSAHHVVIDGEAE